MIGLIIAVIAYMVASTGFFGGDIIYALDVVENWYYFIAIFIGLMATAIMLGFTGVGAAQGSKMGGGFGAFGGALAGYSLGGLFAVIMLAKIAIQLWLVTWLMGSIDPQAVNVDALTNKQMIGLVALIIIALIPSRGGKS